MSEFSSLPNGRSLSDFFSHLVMMPRWHKRLLWLASVLLGAGVLGQGAGYFSATPARSITPDAGINSSRIQISPGISTDQAKPTVTQSLSPHAIKIGVSFIIAFIVGWLARAFVKMVTLLASLGAAVLLGLSYLGIFNVDFTAVQHEYATNAQWAIGQSQHLATALIHHLPSSVSGGAGVLVGFRRR